MNKFFLSIIFIALSIGLSAQGLRHSVCVVEPEFTTEDKALLSDYSLYMARAGFRSAARAITASKNDGTFGSGVLVERNGTKYVITNLHVVSYAPAATISFQLHDKTLRYTNCRVVATGKNCDLAAIELPQECEMLPLDLYASDIDEDMAIVAAGFPELGDKPSWQLTRGYISNARLETFDNAPASHIIQHTASIDPGSSGGPLLLKGEDGKYHILGINTWKAFYREGVGLAIGGEDVNTFIAGIARDSAQEHKAIEHIQSTSGEDWLYVYKQLPDSTQKKIHDFDWRLPLDQALMVLAARDSIVKTDSKKAKHYQHSATHVVSDMDHNRYACILYDNYLGMNQQVTALFGVDWRGYVATGLQVSALIARVLQRSYIYGVPSEYETRGGAMFGIFLGGQVPISVGKYVLAPRITQSAGAGPLKSMSTDGGFAIITDTRVGLDWRVPFPSCDLIVGLHYNMNWMWTKDQLEIPVMQITSFGFNQYLQHGIGITLGVGF